MKTSSLLLTFAEDVRVIFIMLAERLYIMRGLKGYTEEERQNIAMKHPFCMPLWHTDWDFIP